METFAGIFGIVWAFLIETLGWVWFGVGWIWEWVMVAMSIVWAVLGMGLSWVADLAGPSTQGWVGTAWGMAKTGMMYIAIGIAGIVGLIMLVGILGSLFRSEMAKTKAGTPRKGDDPENVDPPPRWLKDGHVYGYNPGRGSREI